MPLNTHRSETPDDKPSMSWLSFVLILPCLTASSLWGQVAPKHAQPQNQTEEEHVRQLMESLPPDSRWRKMLEHGARGDGIHQPWMDHMRRDAVELAIFTFEFAWTDGGRKLKDWTLVSERYFRDYDESQPALEGQQLNLIRQDGLPAVLESVALARAKIGIWVEYPDEEEGTGHKRVYLADNEWLPVQMFPWFAQYDPGTTPLMHAALLGDVPRINKLLAEGADVNAVSSDGTTALVYAAVSSNPVAVEALLRAGADVKTKAGDSALITAAAGGDLLSVKLLLKAGADPNSRSAGGVSALGIARQRHYADVAKLLEQAGAKE